MKKLRILNVVLVVAALAAAIIGIAFSLAPEDVPEKAERTVEDCVFDAKRYTKQGAYDMAAVLYSDALALDDSNYDALLGLAQIYVTNQDYDKALDTYNTMADLYPDDADSQTKRIWLMINLDMLDQVKAELPVISARIKDEGIRELADSLHPDVPTFDVPEGEYDDYFLLRLDAAEDCEIYYTVDGTDPTGNSKVYTDDGIVVSRPETIIRAAARNALGFWSESTEYRYVVTKQVLPISWKNGAGIGEVISNSLGLTYETQVYNYDLAQIRELYLIGSNYYGTDPGMIFYPDYYSYSVGMPATDLKYVFNKRGTAVLDYLPFLKTLGMCYQSIVDMEDIASLQYLENLSLMCDGIEDISALAQLKNLKQLNLGWNSISDITPLVGMEQLESLGLWGNEIQDVSCVRMLRQLKKLDLSDNPVSDISALSGMELNELIIVDTNAKNLAPGAGSSIGTVLWNGEG